MRFFDALKRGTKAPSAGLRRVLWASTQANCRGEKTPQASPVSPLDLVEPASVTERRRLFLLVLACVFIFWLLLNLVLAVVFIQLTSWEIERRAIRASLKDVSHSESELDGWMARRLYCSPSQPCDVYNPFSGADLFFWKYETISPRETSQWRL